MIYKCNRFCIDNKKNKPYKNVQSNWTSPIYYVFGINNYSLQINSWVPFLQRVRYPAFSEGRSSPPEPVPSCVLRHSNILYRGLWRLCCWHLAFTTLHGHHDLCCPHRTSNPGKLCSKKHHDKYYSRIIITFCTKLKHTISLSIR